QTGRGSPVKDVRALRSERPSLRLFPGTTCAGQKPTTIAPLPSGVGQRPGPCAALVQGEYRRSFGPLNFTGVRRGGPDDYRRRETRRARSRGAAAPADRARKRGRVVPGCAVVGGLRSRGGCASG